MDNGSAGWLLFFGVVIGLLLVRRPIDVDIRQEQNASSVVNVPSGGSGAQYRSTPVIPLLLAGGAIVGLIAVSNNSTEQVRAISQVSQTAIVEQAAVSTAGLEAQMKLAEDAAHYASPLRAAAQASPFDFVNALTMGLSMIASISWMAVVMVWLRNRRRRGIAVDVKQNLFEDALKQK